MGLLTEINSLLKLHEARLADINREERTTEGYIIGEESNRNKTIGSILSKITEAVDGAGLKPEEYNKIINEWKKRPLDNDVAGRDKLVEILIEAQLQAIKKAIKGEK